jgi:hypothetical protein
MTLKAKIFPEMEHEVDFCVVGGGMAGVCAALAGARHGAKVALMHDRPVLGGNASSECRIHICGADIHNHHPHMRETGILEELRLENLRRNPQRSFSVWDLILYEKLQHEPNLTLLLNCSCLEATMEGGRIRDVTGWQLTTQTRHTVRASVFADCSGDAILAPLTGAKFRVGHEARHEFGESVAPETADERTMGMTCLFQTREYDSPQPFEAPDWIYRFDSHDQLPYGAEGHRWWEMGYWWVELGGEHDGIHQTEFLRDELLKIALGVWDHIKNRGSHGADNWALEWLQFLPAKRESRRYLGEHVLTQLDIESEGRFDDLVAYGGWSIDDHHPAGFRAAKLGYPATLFHPAPVPYGIPFRSLYSKNVENLMFAGRCASCTHVAMSSTRVMGTCSVMGQAVGTAAALAARLGLSPGEIGGRIRELQQTLLEDDCFLPWVVREMPVLTKTARLVTSQGNGEPLRDGVSRQLGGDPHAWVARTHDHAAYLFDSPQKLRRVTLVLDTAMEKLIQMSYHQADDQLTAPPDVTPRTFRIQALSGSTWRDLARITNNCQRLVRLPVDTLAQGIRFVLDETWGAPESRVYAFYVA